MGIVEGEERSACRRAPTRTETFPPRAKLRGAERHRVVELAVEELAVVFARAFAHGELPACASH